MHVESDPVSSRVNPRLDHLRKAEARIARVAA